MITNHIHTESIIYIKKKDQQKQDLIPELKIYEREQERERSQIFRAPLLKKLGPDFSFRVVHSVRETSIAFF